MSPSPRLCNLGAPQVPAVRPILLIDRDHQFVLVMNNGWRCQLLGSLIDAGELAYS